MIIRSIFIFFAFCFVNTINAEKLQSTIHITPTRPLTGQEGKIIPVTYVALSAVVKNGSKETSPVGEIYVRFSFRAPHQNDPNSILFQTEKVGLPALAPGEEKVITFKTNHLLPTLFDYVKYDWAMREYEAVMDVEGDQEVIGTRAIAFSAYYYEGVQG